MRGYVVMLGVLAASWGASYLFIKVAVEDLEPAPMMCLRLILAFAALFPVLAFASGVRGAVSAIKETGRGGALLGLINMAIPFTLIAWGEKHIDSGVAAIANSTVPIFVAILAIWFRPSERVSGMDHGAAAEPSGQQPATDMGAMKMRDFSNASQVRKGPGVQTIAPMPMDRTGEPGQGLEDVGHKVLVYRNLMALDRNPDVRAPSRSIDIHLTGNMERFMWSFDGEKMSDKHEPIPFTEGERVRVNLINDTMMSHPIHIHGHFFELVTGHVRGQGLLNGRRRRPLGAAARAAAAAQHPARCRDRGGNAAFRRRRTGPRGATTPGKARIALVAARSTAIRGIAHCRPGRRDRGTDLAVERRPDRTQKPADPTGSARSGADRIAGPAGTGCTAVPCANRPGGNSARQSLVACARAWQPGGETGRHGPGRRDGGGNPASADGIHAGPGRAPAASATRA